MDSHRIRRFAAAAILITAAAGQAFAQVPLVAEPSSLTFNISTGTPPTQNLRIRRQDNGPTGVATVTPSQGVTATVIDPPTGIANTPFTLRVGVNPAALPVGATQASITIGGAGFQFLTVPITITGGTGGGGTGAFTASPTSLQFIQTGTTVPPAQTIFVSSNVTTTPTYSVVIDPPTTTWLVTSPAHATIGSSPTVTVTPVSSALATGTYQATVRLTPQNVSAFPVDIPITLSVNQAGTTPLTVSPSTIAFTFPAGTTTSQSQVLFVSSATPVAFTPTLSSNLAGIVNVSGVTTTNSQLTISIPFPQFVTAGTTGTLTLTPAAGSGLAAVNVPIQINAGTGGFGFLSASPATLTFTGAVGSTATVPAQNLTVTAPDNSVQFFQASATSTNNFLFVSVPNNTTPATVSIGVNMAAITQPGTYTGTITLTPLSGGLQTTIPVTLNATSAITVTPNPATSTPSGAAGGPVVQQNIQLSSTTPDVPFTTTVATTSGGQWLSVTTNNTTLPGTITINANPAALSPGTYAGSVTVTAQNVTVATIPVTFTVTAAATMQLSPATLTFNHQTTSTTAPAAQAVQVTSSGAVLNWNAAASSTGGWLQVTPATGTTPGSFNVSVNTTGLAVGTYTGVVNVSSSGATNTPQTVNVTLNVTTPALPQVTSVVNGASGVPTAAAAGLIATIFGTDLGPNPPVAAQVNAQGFIDTTLGGLRVFFDGVPAPVLYASPTQVNVVVPYEIGGRFSTRMQVEARNQRSREIELRVAETAPGIFTINGSGSGQGSVLNQNGTVNGSANPEQRGNVIVIYATGHGETSPRGTTGRVLPANDLRQVMASVVVRIGGRPAQVLYAGSAPGLISGALQINARVAADASTGANVPVEVQIGGTSSQSGVTVAIQ